MGTITANVMMTLNGVAGQPERWQFEYSSPEMHGLMGRQLASSTALLLGRRTYEDFVRYWPTPGAAGNPMSPVMNGLRKYVVSTTLRSAQWNNAEVVAGNVADRLRPLRAEPAGALNIIGSPTLVRSLLAAGLIDRVSLMVFPVVATGQPLFEGPASETGLELTHCQELPHGVLHLDYCPVRIDREGSS
ncbi:dihydrofolate reductase family protein [Agromyces sp. NPDC049794]|uniref:dihydrofolate reductase family protein n=1 Tax=unclassified Agromyces TaxID=2639701 RepID=UPI0033E24442